MNRVLALIAIMIALLVPALALSNPVYAAVDLFKACNIATADRTKPSVCKDVNTQNNTDRNPVNVLLKTVLGILAFVAGVAAILLIIINGFRLILSNGDSNSVSSARTGLIYALIGVAIVVTAQTIVVFVLDKVQ